MRDENTETTAPDLPEQLPIFPLGGVLLLPSGQLPLNIFEDRYIAMVEDAFKAERMIGMIQPRDPDSGKLFDTGCAGKITTFNEMDDGRYTITLTGVSRFNIDEELSQKNGYRRIKADWSAFENDMNLKTCLDLDREKLRQLLQDYFDLQGISCDWEAIEGATDQKLITCLSMICPFEASEKQALLEAECCRTRADMFITMLEMAVHGECNDGCH